MRKLALLGIILVSLTLAVFAQEPLTNASIEKMTKAGLGENVILSMVQTQPGKYDLSPDAMVALKSEGVSDKVLAAMAARNGMPAATAPAAKATDAYDDLEPGVYFKDKDGAWTLVKSEPVNWKTGGVLKSFASQGIVKGDVNGHFNGKDSLTKLVTPFEILIKAPDQNEATDYQLVHLHVNSDNREFRTKTGGVFHSSGGASRDAIEFEQNRVGKHCYTITIKGKFEPNSEYAFLAPGLTNSTASGSTGKGYTFHFLE